MQKNNNSKMDRNNSSKNVPQFKLKKGDCVVIGIKGKDFWGFSKNLKKPFDDILIKTMQKTLKYLCENTQGCMLGYSYYDTIYLFLAENKNHSASVQFCDKHAQICSKSANIATTAFNNFFEEEIETYIEHIYESDSDIILQNIDYMDNLLDALDNCPIFDTHCFNISKDEISVFIYCAQLTAGSHIILSQCVFGDKDLQDKSVLIDQISQSFGILCVRNQKENEYTWIVDFDMLVSNIYNREYITRYILACEE